MKDRRRMGLASLLLLGVLMLIHMPAAHAQELKRRIIFIPGIIPDCRIVDFTRLQDVSWFEPCDSGSSYGAVSRGQDTFGTPNSSIIQHLRAVGYADADFRYFNYAPDWQGNSAYLGLSTRQAIQNSATYLDQQIRFWGLDGQEYDIVTHSLGGAIAAYWAATADDQSLRSVHSIITLDSPVNGMNTPDATTLEAAGLWINAGGVAGQNLRDPAIIAMIAGSVRAVDMISLGNSEDQVVPQDAATLQGACPPPEVADGSCQITLDSTWPGHGEVLNDPKALKLLDDTLGWDGPRWSSRHSAAPMVDPTQELAFLSSSNDLELASLDGSGAHTVTRGPVGPPVWSHDGTRLAYVRNDGSGAYQIEIFTLVTGSTNVVVPKRSLDETGRFFYYFSDVRWSPGDANLYYHWDHTTTSNVGNARLDLATGIEENVDGTRTIDVAANGSRAYTHYDDVRDRTGVDLYVIGIDGRRRLVRSANQPGVGEPLWSPDSNLLLTIGDGLYVMGTDGSGQRRLVASVPGHPIAHASWSPEGQTILFDRDGRMWSVPVDGGTPKSLFAALAPARRPHPASAPVEPAWIEPAVARGFEILSVRGSGAMTEQITPFDSVVVQFSEPVDTEYFQLIIDPNFAASQSLSPDGQTLTLQPVTAWSSGQTYAVTIKAASETRAGEKLGQDYTFSFTAGLPGSSISTAPTSESLPLSAPVPAGVLLQSGTQGCGPASRCDNLKRVDFEVDRAQANVVAPAPGLLSRLEIQFDNYACATLRLVDGADLNICGLAGVTADRSLIGKQVNRGTTLGRLLDTSVSLKLQANGSPLPFSGSHSIEGRDLDTELPSCHGALVLCGRFPIESTTTPIP